MVVISKCYILGFAWQELHNPKNGLTEVDGEECVEEEEELTNRRRSHGGTNNGRGPDGGSGEDVDGVKAYSGQEMKKAYYEAFWRARCAILQL